MSAILEQRLDFYTTHRKSVHKNMSSTCPPQQWLPAVWDLSLFDHRPLPVVCLGPVGPALPHSVGGRPPGTAQGSEVYRQHKVSSDPPRWEVRFYTQLDWCNKEESHYIFFLWSYSNRKTVTCSVCVGSNSLHRKPWFICSSSQCKWSLSDLVSTKGTAFIIHV